MGERRESTSTMAPTEQFCLRWNDFHSNITSAFSEIRDDDDFLDVTLVCDGDIVRAHKLVLSACSPLFRIMLKKNSHPQPMIFLRGIRFPDMVAILNFMYHGEVNVNQEDLQQFLAAAEELRIKGLSQANTWPEAKSDRNDTTTTNQVPKKKMNSGGSSHSTGQPPAKRPRPEDKSSPGVSPVSTPVSAKTPEPEDDDVISSHDPPQLSVKPEFSSKEMGLIAAMDEDRENQSNNSNHAPSGGSGGGNNLLDSIAAVQNFAAFGQGFDQNAMAQQAQQHSAYNSPQHLMSGMGGAASQMNSENNQGKGVDRWVGGLASSGGLTSSGHSGPPSEPPSPSMDGISSMDPISPFTEPGRSPCPFCQKDLKNGHSLNVHISRYHNTDSTPTEVSCPVCEKKYGNKYSLRTHMHLQHKEQLHLLGKRKRGRKPGATISHLNSLLHSAAMDLATGQKRESLDESDSDNPNLMFQKEQFDSEPMEMQQRSSCSVSNPPGRQTQVQQCLNPFSDLALASFNQM